MNGGCRIVSENFNIEIDNMQSLPTRNLQSREGNKYKGVHVCTNTKQNQKKEPRQHKAEGTTTANVGHLI